MCGPHSQRAPGEERSGRTAAFEINIAISRRLKFVFPCCRETELSRTGLVDREQNATLEEALLNTL